MPSNVSRILLPAVMVVAIGIAIAVNLPALAKPMFDRVDSPMLKKAGNDYVLGKEDAPVTMIEYASLSCPHCAHFHKEVLPVLTKKYIDTGKMTYILRPFPLNDPALKAALLVDCVGEQHGAQRYYTFSKVLFEAQNKWAFDTSWLNALATFAKVGGVSTEMFDKCINDSAREIKVLNMKRAGSRELGIDHTPYFFINSHRYDDDVAVDKMSNYIDAVLGEVDKPASKDEKAAPAKDAKAPAKDEPVAKGKDSGAGKK